MATTTEILALKQPSERLKQAINNCSLGFKKLADSIQETLKIGESEGFSPKEIGIMIRQEMTSNGFSLRTVQRYLPAEAKMLSKVRQQVGVEASKFAVNLSAKSDRGLGLTMQPQDYQTEDLPKYTKTFLIEIIHYLEESSSSQIEREKPASRPLSRKMPEQVAKQVIQLHKQGKSSRAIASQLGIGKTSVLRVIQRNK